MKKWLCLVLALLTLTVCVWAAAETPDWNYDLTSALLRGYNGHGGAGTVPDETAGPAGAYTCSEKDDRGG